MKSLQQLRSVMKEPQLLHKWTIEIPTWPTAVQPTSPDILFMITTADFPTEKETPAEIELGGYKLGYNGKTDRSGEITWTFFDNTASDVIKYFFTDYPNAKQNFASISDVSMRSQDNPSLLVPVVNMNLLAADGATITKQIQLINCFFHPTNYGGDLGQSPEVQKPTVTVRFDAFITPKL